MAEKGEGCPLCEVVEKFCDYLSEENKGLCRDLLNKIFKGEISGEEARRILYEKVPKEELAAAEEKIKPLLAPFRSPSE